MLLTQQMRMGRKVDVMRLIVETRLGILAIVWGLNRSMS